MESKLITCDVCGAPKGETNHWFVAITAPADMKGMITAGIAFGPFDSPVKRGYTREHLCGRGCAQKRLSQWLEQASATERTP